jgi:outer membrane lipoprotein-sorting protein
MKIFWFFLFLSGFIITEPTCQQTAKEIVKKADEKARGKTSIAQMTITTTRPKWTRSMELKAWSKGTDLALILVQSPVKDKGVCFLKRKKEVWNWLPSLDRNIKLPPSMMSQSWMGTDFTNDDLVKESSVVDDYEHALVGEEMIGERQCFKIEMIPKEDAAVVWGKLITWIDQKDFLQLRVEFYDEFNELVNVMTGSEIKMIGGRLLPSKMEMVPADKEGHKTVIVYEDIIFDTPLKDDFFSIANMSRVQ